MCAACEGKASSENVYIYTPDGQVIGSASNHGISGERATAVASKSTGRNGLSRKEGNEDALDFM